MFGPSAPSSSPATASARSELSSTLAQPVNVDFDPLPTTTATTHAASTTAAPASSSKPATVSSALQFSASALSSSFADDLPSTCSLCFLPASLRCSSCAKQCCKHHGVADRGLCFSCVAAESAPVGSSMPETELAVLTPRGPRRRSSETPDSWEAIPLPSPSGTFTFADACFGAGEPYANYTSIRGVTRPGLIVDPGAARGLIGSDTLRVLINVVIKPAGMAKHIRWTSSTNLFTGISAATEKSLGIVSIPIGLAGIAWSTFKADVLGGSASCCPGLIPLSSLLSQGCVISCGHFSNGDGELGIQPRTVFALSAFSSPTPAATCCRLASSTCRATSRRTRR